MVGMRLRKEKKKKNQKNLKKRQILSVLWNKKEFFIEFDWWKLWREFQCSTNLVKIEIGFEERDSHWTLTIETVSITRSSLAAMHV